MSDESNEISIHDRLREHQRIVGLNEPITSRIRTTQFLQVILI